MAKPPVNLAKSVKDRLLNLARAEGKVFDVVLVRFALERLLYRLSLSAHRDRFVLKGGMLVTVWLDDDNRVTRDADFLGHGDADADQLVADFQEIMSVDVDDGLVFDVDNLSATANSHPHCTASRPYSGGGGRSEQAATVESLRSLDRARECRTAGGR